MKLSTAFLLLSGLAASAVEAKTIRSNKAMAKVLRSAQKVRRADENAEEEEQQDEFAYLAKYSLKMVSCMSDEQIQNPEDGEYEYQSVLLRLCPSEYGCDSDSKVGCAAGYGDYVVGINTFVEAYFEDQKDNMQGDDDANDFDLNEFAECREYRVENDDDANEQEYYVGPTCTDDGLDIKLALFENYKCVGESDTEFESISNGWSLPYSSGGVVSTYCMDCVEQDENGDYELRELCQQTYEQASYKCESRMEYYSYYGKNEQGCEWITEMLPAKKSSGSGGKVFGWIVFIAVVVGLACYVVWWRKKKAASANDGIMS